MIVMFTLSINFVLTVFNKPIYHFMKDPSSHFAYNYHVAKELASWLKAQDIHALHVKDKKLAHRLKFYGIEAGSGLSLIESNFKTIGTNDFALKYVGNPIAHYMVVKP